MAVVLNYLPAVEGTKGGIQFRPAVEDGALVDPPRAGALAQRLDGVGVRDFTENLDARDTRLRQRGRQPRGDIRDNRETYLVEGEDCSAETIAPVPAGVPISLVVSSL